MATGHHSIFEDQARELYLKCDEEKKGFITREDMYRLISHLPLSGEQLESVFDSLDDDNNGQLTLEEFIVGFGNFLGAPIDLPHEDEEENDCDTSMMQHVAQEHLQHLVDRLHSVGLHEDVEAIKESWSQLQDNNPELLGEFEVIIENIISDMVKSKEEYNKLKGVLKTKSETYEDEVKRLYDEMDIQLRAEKERLYKEEELRVRQLKTQLDTEIKEKDSLLQNIQKTHENNLKKLEELNSVHSESSQEKERLERERNELDAKLRLSDKALRDCQEYIEDLNKKAKLDRRNRAKAAIEMTEGIALERESLVRQLDELKEINKQLQEEKNQKLLYRSISSRDGSIMDLSKELALTTDDCDQQSKAKVFIVPEALKKKRGSILSSYFAPSINVEHESEDVCRSFIYDDDQDNIQEVSTPTTDMFNRPVLSEEKIEYNHAVGLNSTVNLGLPLRQEMEIQTELDDLGERSSPDGAMDIEEELSKGLEKPERIFKVVFIGDSSVGKTSIIQRFSNNEFQENGLPSTVGVDFRIKSLRVDSYFVALQLWDTAGQERFRSITAQYYRKADAVILVYDILSESSLLNLRRWMENVKEGVEDGTVVMVLANKSDKVLEGESKRREAKELRQLIDDVDLLFFECSAKTGDNVNEAFQAMAKLLTSKENNDLKASITLQPAAKKGCCG